MSFSLIALFCCVALFVARNASAQSVVTWIGGSGSWSAGTNWSTGIVPGPTNDVVIGAGAAIIITHASGADVVNSIQSQQALVVSGGSLTVSSNIQVNNLFTMSGGTIIGATILPGTNGAGLTITNGTLDGVTMNGTLDVGYTVNGAALIVTNGLTLAGTMLVGNPTNNNWGRASFSGIQTLAGSGTVVFGGASGNNWVTPLDTNSTLTIGSGITVHGETGFVGAGLGPLVNLGTISCDVASGTITINALQFTNQGLVEAFNGGSLSINVLQNSASGDIVINGGGTLNLLGSWNNAGAINSTNSVVDLGGTFALTNLATFNRTNGTVNLTGNLMNSNAVLALDAVSGSWVLNSGTVQGGTITTAGAASFIINSGTFDGVTMNGTLDVGFTVDGAALTVTNGLTLGGAMLVGNPTNNNWGRASFSGIQTLAGSGTVVFGGASGNNWVTPLDTNSTLTIGAGITVHGQTGFVGAGFGPLVNLGTISCDVAGGTITIDALPFTNQGLVEALNGGSLSINVLQNNASGDIMINGGGTLNLLGSWNNAGTINSTNSVVDLGGTFALTNLATFNRTNGTVNLTGILINSNAVVALDAVTGSWVLNSGTVQGGTITTAGGASFIINSGTLDGVTMNGTLDVGYTVNGAALTVTNGLTLGGTMLVGNPTNNNWGRATFSGTQTLAGGGTVLFGGASANNWVTPLNTNSTLTIGAGITVHGQTGFVGAGFGPLVNLGTISCDVAGGTITIDALPFTNQGLVEALNGGSLSINVLQNSASGDIVVNGGGALNLLGSWNNAGTINSTNSVVDLGGTFALTNLATLNRTNGTVNLTGILLNSNAVVALNAVTGSWTVNGGTVQGGTITTAGGASFIINSGTFDGVTMNGTLDVGFTVNGASLTVTNGLTLGGTMLIGNPTNNNWGRTGFSGTQTLAGGGTVLFGGASGNNWLYPPNTNSTLTIGPGITVHGETGSVGVGLGPLINQGTVSCDVTNGTITIDALPFTNQGQVEAMNGGTLTLIGAWSNTGTLVESGGTLNLSGNFTTAGAGVVSQTNGTINVTGILDNSSGALVFGGTNSEWVLNGGTLQGGSITTAGGASFVVVSGTLNGVTVNGTMDVGYTLNGASVTVTNGLTLGGTMLIGNPTNNNYGRVDFSGSQTLAGGGTVVFGGASLNNWLYSPNTNSTLTIGPGITVRGETGSVGVGLGPLINQGTISCDVTNGTITINALPFSNQGLVEAINGGSITLMNAWSNSGTLVESGGTLNLAGNFSTAGAGVINQTNGTINLTGTLNNSSAGVAFGGTNSVWVLNGGTVQGGAITTIGGATFIVISGTFDGVTMNGTLDVGDTINGASLTVTNGLTLGGTMLLGNSTNGDYGRVSFSGSQNLAGGGTAVFGNSVNNWMYPPNTNSILTIGPGITVHGQTGSVGVGLGPLINQGTISCDVTNGTITINALPFSNQGLVESINGGTITLSSAWSNGGTLVESGGILNLAGNFTTAGVGALNQTNGTINLTGVLNNSSAAVVFGGTNSIWVLNGGTIQGGTVTTTSGASFVVIGGTLNGVTMNGTLDVGDTINGASLTVTNGMTLGGTMLLGNPTNGDYGRVSFSGSQNLAGGGTVVFGSSINDWLYPPNTNSTLTIGPGITVHGQSGSVGVGLGPLINQGLISSDVTNGTITINALPFTNLGTLAMPFGTISLGGTASLAGGALSFGINSSGNFGRMNVTSAIQLGGTLNASLSNSFIPAVSNTFQLLTYPSFTGSFSATNLPAAVSWQTTYSNTAFTIKVLSLASPTVQFSASPSNGPVPLTVNFTSPSVDSANNAITSWRWNFGDGVGTSTNQNPAYTYTNIGVFGPSLTVTNSLHSAIVAAGPSVTVTNNGNASNLVVTLASPTNGQSFSAPATFPLDATVTTLLTNVTVNFYNDTNLLGTVPSSPYNITLSNLPAGTYAFTAVATNTNGMSAASATAYVTVNTPGTTLIDFDPLDTSGNLPVTNGALAAYLAQYGVSATNNSPATSIAVENQADVAGGGFVAASSVPNVLTQIGSNGPVSFTVSFGNLLSQFSFTRPELIANPFVSHPAWQARAFDALGILLDQVQAPQITSFTNVPAQTYTLTGGSIASVEFSSLGTGLTTFNAMLLDDFDLTPGVSSNLPPSAAITSPAPGQVLASMTIPLSVATAAGSGAVTTVSYYYNGILLTNSSNPFSVLWTAPSNGVFVLTAVASNTFGLSSTSSPVPITVAAGLSIATPPESQTIAVSNQATFNVTTTGTNATFQWQFNSTNIIGATNTFYAISNAPVSASGNYTVVVTSGSQSITSAPAALTVLGPPALGPISLTTNGSNITLSLSAGDSVPFYYQWQLNGSIIPGAAASGLTGTTNVSYTITNARPFNSGNYQVVVANAAAAVESPIFNVAAGFGIPVTTNNNFNSSLAIGPLTNGVGVSGINSSSSIPPDDGPEVIAGKPAGGFLWYNWTASFTGVISLTTRGSSFDTLLGVYTGATLSSLTPVAQDDDSGGFFTSLVSFNCVQGTVYQIVVAGYQGVTGTAVLELSPGPAAGLPGPLGGYSVGGSEPVITQQPVNQIVNAGDTVILNVEATGATGYQWYFAGVPVAGGTASALVISNFPPSAVGNFFVQATNAAGSVQSTVAAIQIAAANRNGTPTKLAEDKFGDAVNLTIANTTSRYRPTDSGGDTGGFTLSQSFSTVGATKEEGEPNHAGQPGGASYWYTYTAFASGAIQFDTDGSAFNTILAVYTGPGTSFSSLVNVGAAYTTNYVQQGQPIVLVTNVVSGTTFYIAIDGYLGANGAAHLDVNLNPSTNTSVNTNIPPVTNKNVVVAFTSPVNNFLTTSSNLNVSGTVRGGGGKGLGKTTVLVTVNTNAPVTATLGAGQAVVAWSLSGVVLVPGANSITVQGLSLQSDGTTNASFPVSRTVFLVAGLPSSSVKSALTLATSGRGRITGVENRANLEVNKIYEATAVPAGGWLFTNWTSGTNTNSMSPVSPNTAALSFVMASNLILQANFVPDPFPAVAGVYNGLFASSNGVTGESSGFFTATIPSAGRGAFSARLLLDGGAYPFSGTFDLSGDAGITVARSGTASLIVELHLNLASPDDQITGAVIDGANPGWTSQLMADRAVFNAKSNPATNYDGRYTVLIPPGTNAPVSAPGGFGYATLTNDLGGQISLVGRLGDGTAISQSVPVSKDGYIPLYASLYSRKGSLLGWLALTNNAGNTPPKTILGNNLAWFKRPGNSQILYAGGFTNTNITVLGSFYVPLRNGAGVLPLLTNATLVISNGDLSGALIYSNVTISGDKLVYHGSGTLSGVITPGTGVLTVTFRRAGANHNTVASGIVLQDDSATNAAGWFLGTDQSGFFLLQQ